MKCSTLRPVPSGNFLASGSDGVTSPSTVRHQVITEDAVRTLAACATDLPKLAGKNILLTGATGFIGGSIADALIAFNAGHARPCQLFLPTRSRVRAKIARPDLQGPGVNWLEWRRDGTVDRANARIDYAIHAAAAVDPATIARAPLAAASDTVWLTEQVLELACTDGTAGLLYLSSGAVYGEQPQELAAIPEDFAGGAREPGAGATYAETKRHCEMLVRQSGVPAMAARLFACFGPRQAEDASFAVPDFFRQAREHGRIVVNGDGSALRTTCYVSDVVAALLKLLLHCGPGMRACNVGAAEPVVSIAELAGRIARVMGGLEVSITGKEPGMQRQRYVPDISLMRSFHSPQIDLDQGLARVAAAQPPVFATRERVSAEGDR
jgi:UDP-glucuronate decarboxylase